MNAAQRVQKPIMTRRPPKNSIGPAINTMEVSLVPPAGKQKAFVNRATEKEILQQSEG